MANEKRLIDANALLEKMQYRLPKNDAVAELINECVEISRKQVMIAPTVDAVEVVHGRWINNGGHRKMDLYCSVCNRRASNFVGGYEDWWDLWFPKYCPNCGAKMDGDGTVDA